METNAKLWTAIASTAALTAILVESYHHFYPSRAPSNSRLKNRGVSKESQEYSEELIKEQLTRNYAFLKEDGMKKIRDLRVVVVGCGGVGSWVTTMLVRSGVGKVRVIDFDQVSLSSLNRHAVATLKDVGTPKVECLKNHLLDVAPWIEIDSINALWSKENGEELIFKDNFNPTYVVDCIDNIDTKVDFLEFCYKKKIPVIASGGAALKSDPTRINIADISMTEEDMLSKAVRLRLKKRGINNNIPFVFSTEKPDSNKAHLLELDDAEFEEGNVEQLAAIQNFRVRILPVIGTMPAVFGLTIANYIITTVSGYPTEPIKGKNRHKVYEGIYHSLAGQQSRMGNLEQRIPVAQTDIVYLVDEIFRGKSPISNYSTRLTLSQWDPKKPISCQNLVVMTKDEQKNHETRVLKGGQLLSEVYSKEVIELVNKRFQEELFYSQFR